VTEEEGGKNHVLSIPRNITVADWDYGWPFVCRLVDPYSLLSNIEYVYRIGKVHVRFEKVDTLSKT
jgi:hypothetical protein